MSQTVRCPNIIRFDKEQQQYVYCEHVFTVDGTNSGKVVECPTCGGEVRLGGVDLSRADTIVIDESVSEKTDLGFFSPEADLQDNSAVESRATDAASDRSELDDIFADPPSTADLDADLVEQINDAHPFQGDLDDAEFSDPGFVFQDPVIPEALFAAPLETSELKAGINTDPAEHAETPQLPGPVASFHSANLQMARYCPSCGAPLPAEQVLCGGCGFHKKLQRRIRPGNADDDAEPQLRGFQLWLQNNLAEGESIQGLLLLVGVLLVVLLVGMAVTTFVAYGLWAVLFLPPLLLVVVLMLNVVAAGVSNKATGLGGIVQRILWTALLRFYRITRWQLCSWPPGTTRVWARRDAKFGDDDLLEASDLDQHQVIDLEGSAISDEGLVYLTAYPRLRFIVLRKTKASDEGIDRLQNAIPAAWIWR